MGRLFSIVLIFCMTATLCIPALGAQAIPSGSKTLTRGTPLKLELLESIGTQRNQEGDRVTFRVTDDVIQDGKVLIAEGALAFGSITKLKSAKSWGRSGEIEVSIQSVLAADGTYVPLTSSIQKEKEYKIGETAGAAIGGAIIIAFPIGLAAGGAVKGKKILIGRGLNLDVFIDKDTEVRAYSESQAAKIKAAYEKEAIDNAIKFVQDFAPLGEKSLLNVLTELGNKPEDMVWEANRIDDFSFVVKVTGFTGDYLFKAYPYDNVHKGSEKFDILTGVDARSRDIIDQVK